MCNNTCKRSICIPYSATWWQIIVILFFITFALHHLCIRDYCLLLTFPTLDVIFQYYSLTNSLSLTTNSIKLIDFVLFAKLIAYWIACKLYWMGLFVLFEVHNQYLEKQLNHSRWLWCNGLFRNSDYIIFNHHFGRHTIIQSIDRWSNQKHLTFFFKSSMKWRFSENYDRFFHIWTIYCSNQLYPEFLSYCVLKCLCLHCLLNFILKHTQMNKAHFVSFSCANFIMIFSSMKEWRQWNSWFRTKLWNLVSLIALKMLELQIYNDIDCLVKYKPIDLSYSFDFHCPLISNHWK